MGGILAGAGTLVLPTPDRWLCAPNPPRGEPRCVNNSNYDVTAHSEVFWVVFLAIMVVSVVALMGLFLYGVARGENGERHAPK
jgi:hypothetical protein